MSESTSQLVGRIDDLQRSRPVLGFPYAVVKRYYEDRGGWLGSLISYYGFFSLYPLLVAFTAIATWLFNDKPSTLERILEAVWSKVPFTSSGLDEQVQQQVKDWSGQGWIALVSLLVSLWGAAGVVRVLQDAVNSMWGVPRYKRPHFFAKLARGAAIIGLLGLGMIGSAVVAGVTLAVDDLPVMAAVGAAAGNVCLSAAVAMAVYRLTLGRSITFGELWPGALIMGIGIWFLTLIGGLYIQHVISRMTGVFGPFASTIGLLAYVSLAVQIFVFATEVNVVRARRLWPRALTTQLGDPDRRAIALSMQREALFAPTILQEQPDSP